MGDKQKTACLVKIQHSPSNVLQSHCAINRLESPFQPRIPPLTPLRQLRAMDFSSIATQIRSKHEYIVPQIWASVLDVKSTESIVLVTATTCLSQRARFTIPLTTALYDHFRISWTSFSHTTPLEIDSAYSPSILSERFMIAFYYHPRPPPLSPLCPTTFHRPSSERITRVRRSYGMHQRCSRGTSSRLLHWHICM